MNEAEIKEILSKMGALDGEGDSQHIDAVALMQDPIVTNRLAVELLQRIDRDAKPELVLALEGDGSYFGYSVALAAWMRFVYASKTSDGYATPEGAPILQKNKTLVVLDTYDDEVATALVALAEEKGAKVQAVLSLVGPKSTPSVKVPCISLL